MNHTAYAKLKWKTPIEKAFGYTPDISALVQFAFYEPVYYYNADLPFPKSKESFGRFVGLAHNTGDALKYYILTMDDRVIARSVLRSALNGTFTNKRALDASKGEYTTVNETSFLP